MTPDLKSKESSTKRYWLRFFYDQSECGVCPDCNGWGRYTGDKVTLCPKCQGTGFNKMEDARREFTGPRHDSRTRT